MVLSYKNGNFMGNEGIVLSLLVSNRVIKVDKPKVKVIEKLPSLSPNCLPRMCSFSLRRNVCVLLYRSNQALSTAPITKSMDHRLLFEVMYDASYNVLGSSFKVYEQK